MTDTTQEFYNMKEVRQFAIMTVVWGVVAMLVGVVILLLNFIDGLTKLAKVNWHVAWQILMSLCYIAVSIRLIQLILAFRGGE